MLHTVVPHVSPLTESLSHFGTHILSHFSQNTSFALLIMVVTRGGNYNAHGEEKKDDDEPIVLDSQQFTSEHKTTEENNLSVKQKKNASIQQDTKEVQRKSPLLLLVCAIGITSCYLW